MKMTDRKHIFGHWTVLKRNHDGTWLCHCRCGTKENVPEAWLLSGFSKSCGCRKSKVKDLREKRFGRLTAIEPIGKKYADGSIRWRCICDCGNETIVSSNHLLQNHTTSCGCWRNEVFGTGRTYIDGTCLEILFSPKLRLNNKSGHTGVYKKRTKWIAYITVGKQFYRLGSFDEYEDAVAARKKAEQEWKDKFRKQMESLNIEKESLNYDE